MRNPSASPLLQGGLGAPETPHAADAWPGLLASALIEAIGRHLDARLAAFALDGLVCWPSGELSAGALATVRGAAGAVERERRPVVLRRRTPSVMAAPLLGRRGWLGALVVVTSDAVAAGAPSRIEALARQAAAALENASLPGRGEQPPGRLSVVLVDAHTIVRQGLRSLLEREGATVVGEAGSAPAALDVIELSQPDVALLDLELSQAGPGEGLDLCGRVSERFPRVGVVVLTAVRDHALVLEALRRGARGYVVKDVDLVGLVSVVRAVKRGESGFDSHSAAAIVRSVAGGAVGRRPGLSGRELEVVRLVARGRTNREIGAACFISESTVKFHIRHAMAKLGAHHRTEIVYAAGRLGLI